MYVQLVRKLMGIIISLKKSNNCIDYVYVTVISIQLFLYFVRIFMVSNMIMLSLNSLHGLNKMK
jgi:hypothetical protein